MEIPSSGLILPEPHYQIDRNALYKVNCQSCRYTRYHEYHLAMHKAQVHVRKHRTHIAYVLDEAGLPVERFVYEAAVTPEHPPF